MEAPSRAPHIPLQAQRQHQASNTMITRRPSRRTPAYPPPKTSQSSRPPDPTQDDDITPKANTHHLRSNSPALTATSSAPSVVSNSSWRPSSMISMISQTMTRHSFQSRYRTPSSRSCPERTSLETGYLPWSFHHQPHGLRFKS